MPQASDVSKQYGSIIATVFFILGVIALSFRKSHGMLRFKMILFV